MRGESISSVQCPVLLSTAQGRHGHSKMSSPKGSGGDAGTRESLVQGETERAETVQPTREGSGEFSGFQYLMGRSKD